MNQFSLFKQLSNPPKEKLSTTPLLPTGIRYQQYDIDLVNCIKTISIPLRESESFEEALLKVSQPITEEALNILLRKFRGIRG